MIVGIGVDVTHVARMRGELARSEGGFRDAVFTEAEAAECEACEDPAVEFATRFAAKEAAVKALGVGIRGDVAWDCVEVLQESLGVRRITFHGGARMRAEAIGVRAIWFSCVVHGGDAVAWVVLES